MDFSVAQGLNLIQAGLDQVANRRGLVRVAVLPMFASRWLSLRLSLMWEAQPGGLARFSCDPAVERRAGRGLQR